MKKYTILFLTDSWTNIDDRIRAGEVPGGTASVWRIWEECARRGYETHVFVMCKPPIGQAKEMTALGGVRFHWIAHPWFGATQWLAKHGLRGIFSPHWILHQIKMLYCVLASGIRPDVVYCMRKSFSIIARLFCWCVGAKLVLRIYGTWLYHDWFQQRKWMPRIKGIGSWIGLRMPVDLIIMTNDGTSGDKAARWAGCDMRRFRFWLNGTNKQMRIEDFDARAFKQQRLGISPDTPMLMTLGRLADWKRLDRILDAMPAIIKAYPDARLYLLGGGPLRDTLEARAARLGITPSIVFVGPVGHHEIQEYLNAADLYLQAYDLSNLSNTIIEAMSAGCCIITRDVGSTRDIVTDGENGLLLSPGEAKDYAQAAIHLLSDPEERSRLAEGAYQYAMKHFQTWDERMDMELNELEHLMGKAEK